MSKWKKFWLVICVGIITAAVVAACYRAPPAKEVETISQLMCIDTNGQLVYLDQEMGSKVYFTNGSITYLNSEGVLIHRMMFFGEACGYWASIPKAKAMILGPQEESE